MTQIKLKSVIEFLFWIGLFVLALAYFNKNLNLTVYFVIGAFLLVLVITEIVLGFEYKHKKAEELKKIKKEQIKQNKKVFYKELTFFFSFIVILITMFSLIIQKDKFIEFLSFKHPSLYIISAWFIVAWVITILEFIDYRRLYRKPKKKKESEFIVKMKYDFTFLFGIIVVVLAYFFLNWVTALLGLALMVVSLLGYNLTSKKKRTEKKIVQPKKIAQKKIPKEQKLRLLLESPIGKIRMEEKKAKEEARMEKLKLRELQRKIREEEKRRKREEKLKQKQEKLKKLKDFFRQKKIEMEKKKLEKIKESKEKILMKEKKLGKIQKSREEIEEMIRMKKSIGQKEKYETDFDRLLALLNKYERLKLSDIAKIFGISIKQAEEWATILEEHKLLEIHYPAVGEPELRLIK